MHDMIRWMTLLTILPQWNIWKKEKTSVDDHNETVVIFNYPDESITSFRCFSYKVDNATVNKAAIKANFYKHHKDLGIIIPIIALLSHQPINTEILKYLM